MLSPVRTAHGLIRTPAVATTYPFFVRPHEAQPTTDTRAIGAGVVIETTTHMVRIDPESKFGHGFAGSLTR
jgi:hypothetical protein